MNGWKGRQTVRQMELQGEINNASGGVSEEKKEKGKGNYNKERERERERKAQQGRI